MENELDYISAIQADPEDVDRRLRYADWLERHGKHDAASYLRTEDQLTKLPVGSPDAKHLRDRLWQAWASVDPEWLMVFTQPRMLRANPTPFPCAWQNHKLKPLRVAESTFGTWSYDSIPPLPVGELSGEFQYLKSAGDADVPGENGPRFAERLQNAIRDAEALEIQLPPSFLAIMNQPKLRKLVFSPTNCYFIPPTEHVPIQLDPTGEGIHVSCYSDSQDGIHWGLFIHRSGAHCVVAMNRAYLDPQRFASSKGEIWFVAPSFEAFVYRVWIEGQIWLILNPDIWEQMPAVLKEAYEPMIAPPMTPEFEQYMQHYRNQATNA